MTAVARAQSGQRAQLTVDSPVGPLTLVASRGKLAELQLPTSAGSASGHGRAGSAGEQERAGSGGQGPAGSGGGHGPALSGGGQGPALSADGQGPEAGSTDSAVLAAAASQLRAYFAGELTSFDLPLGPEGTPFQQKVWAALREIPYGVTASYGELAERIGQRSASRAVGLANGRNPIAIVVPCHRVIGSDGSLTGYGGGLDRKRFLLDLERRVSGQLLI
jgi:methylated-DNA-[protein]-cysteine S-methyltransferase